MFPGGVNPKQMAQMMRQMGIKSGEVKATKVIIEEESGKKMIFSSPQVQWMDVQGKRTYTVIGDPQEEAAGIPEDDIQMVAEQAGVTKEKAKKALEESSGDIAEAIMKLKE
ncbi:MAG: nascent polypeptide-associated complex protein [archaeon]